MNTFTDRAIGLLREEVDKAGGLREFARLHNIQPSQISRWLSGSTSPKLDDLGRVFDAIGIDLSRNSSCCGGRPVKILCPEHVPREDLNEISDSFVAIPVVNDPDDVSVNGYAVPKYNRESWALVDKSFQSVSGRSDLIVVPVSDSDMSPTLNDGDLVLVDRDRAPVKNGRIYLCRSPRSSETGFRRVVLEEMPDGDTQIIMTNDNMLGVRPRSFSLRKDYEGDIFKAVLGRAIWIRTSIEDK